MDALYYKVIHLTGLIALFLGVGGMITFSKGSSPARGLIAAFHGIGLFLILVSGFGMIAKLKLGFPGWVIVKVVLWLALGAMLALGKKGILKGPALWGTALLLGAIAAYLGVMKPF